MNSRMIADIIKNQLRENLEMTIKEVRSLVKQKFPTVQPSYNKLWRESELTITDLFDSWERSYEMFFVSASSHTKFHIWDKIHHRDDTLNKVWC
jgi:hypothetical protein